MQNTTADPSSGSQMLSGNDTFPSILWLKEILLAILYEIDLSVGVTDDFEVTTPSHTKFDDKQSLLPRKWVPDGMPIMPNQFY